MLGLIKLITVLILLTGLTVYGGDIWNGIKDRVSLFINPELQQANIFDSLKNNFSDIEKIIKEVNENIDNPNFDKKAKLEEGLKLIEESKNSLEEMGKSDSSLIEKTFEAARDLKEGIKSLISGETENDSRGCQCDSETE